jgi:hypothetical protein
MKTLWKSTFRTCKKTPCITRGRLGFWCLAIVLLCSQAALAQGARSLADNTPLYKKPKPSAKVIEQVAAGTEFELRWNSVKTIDMITNSSLRSTELFGQVIRDKTVAKVEAILPSTSQDGELWVAVKSPKGKNAWVQRNAVELTPGKRIGTKNPVDFLIPVEPDEIPQLLEARIPSMTNEMLAAFSKTYVFAQLFVIIDPDGVTLASAVVRPSGQPKFDNVLEAIAMNFRFEPIRRGEKPVHAIVNFRISFNIGSGAVVIQ